MKKLAFFSFATLAVLLSSCADLASVENTELETNTIAAVMEGVQTKTSTTDEGHFSWSEGDNIWLETTADYVLGTLSAGAGTPNATFNYGSFFGDLTGKSVYPYNEGHSVEGDVLNVVLPASYDLGSNLDNTNSPMYGVNVGGTLKFNHLAGVMRFSFKNVPAGVDRFTFTVDKKINGTFAADLTADYPVLQTEAAQADAERTVTFNFDALANTSDVKIFVPLPLGTYESLELALYKGEESVWTYSKAVTNTINRKSLKLMPTVSMGGSIGGDIENDGTIGGDIEDEVKFAPADQIWYSATEKVEFNNLESSFFGTLEVKSHDYDPSTQKGIITFTNSVFGIPNSFLANPEVVTDIVLPEDIVYFESLALAGCNFTSVTLPSNVQFMEQYALYSETLKELNVLTTVLSDMSSAVNLAVLEKITGPWASSDGRFLIDEEGNLKAIALSGVTELSIPDGVKAIAVAVKSDKLVKVNIPSSTTTLNMNFASCPALKEVHIDSQNLKGDYNPFYGCSLLEKFTGPLASADGRCLIANNILISLAGSGISEYTVPEGVEEIGMYVWDLCKHFQKLTLPSTMIDASYMDTLSSLESLYCLSPEPPRGLYYLKKNVKVYVPSQYYSTYQAEWGEKFNIYSIEDAYMTYLRKDEFGASGVAEVKNATATSCDYTIKSFADCGADRNIYDALYFDTNLTKGTWKYVVPEEDESWLIVGMDPDQNVILIQAGPNEGSAERSSKIEIRSRNTNTLYYTINVIQAPEPVTYINCGQWFHQVGQDTTFNNDLSVYSNAKELVCEALTDSPWISIELCKANGDHWVVEANMTANTTTERRTADFKVYPVGKPDTYVVLRYEQYALGE